jgi:hypothetical protein
MAEPSEQDRMTARQHTAQLLKMLRGAGSGAVPPVAANGMRGSVARCRATA